jgi:hypothetical protein
MFLWTKDKDEMSMVAEAPENEMGTTSIQGIITHNRISARCEFTTINAVPIVAAFFRRMSSSELDCKANTGSGP